MSVDYEAEVLGALVDELELDRVSLFGSSCGGPTAIVYAERNPERVDRLILYGTYANGADLGSADMRRATIELVGTHWGLGSRVLADIFVPSAEPDDRDAFAAFQRDSADAPMAASLMELIWDTDVSESATRLDAPALVVHRRGDRAIRIKAGERLATLVPNATLVELDGDAHPPWYGDVEDLARAIGPFLGVSAKPRFTQHELATLARVDAHSHSFVAWVDGDPEPAGFAQLVGDADERTHAEIAFAVADVYHGRGIGSALVDQLAADARAAGITHLTATIQSSNTAAFVLVKRVARPTDIRFEGGEASLIAAVSAA
jgi:ribosomal protein S18 acetylase RimI-like enzyme